MRSHHIIRHKVALFTPNLKLDHVLCAECRNEWTMQQMKHISYTQKCINTLLSCCNTGCEKQHVPSFSLLKEDSYTKTKVIQIQLISTATSSVWFHRSHFIKQLSQSTCYLRLKKKVSPWWEVWSFFCSRRTRLVSVCSAGALFSPSLQSDG